MAAQIVSADEIKKLRKEFLNAGPITFRSLMEFTATLKERGCDQYTLRGVVNKAVVKMKTHEVSLLVEHSKSETCPGWLNYWRYTLDDKTPDEHLSLLQEHMADSLHNLDWDLVCHATKMELLKISRDYRKRKAVSGRLDDVARAEKRIAVELEHLSKLRERVKRDASPTRK